jgi:hypothetical protein
MRSLEKSVSPRQKMVAQSWQDYEKIFYKERPSEDRLLFFFNTPFLYTCMQFFVSGDYERDISLYYLIQLACFIFFIMIVMYLLKFPFVSILYPSILFSVFYGPFLCDMRVGNVVLMQLAFIALFLACAHLIRKKDTGLLIGGTFLGFMVFFKPNMIFLPFMLFAGWLVLKQFRQVILSSIGMIVGSIVALLSAAMFFSTFRVWFWWFKSACNVSNLPYVSVEEGNFALSRVLWEMCGIQKLPFIFLDFPRRHNCDRHLPKKEKSFKTVCSTAIFFAGKPSDDQHWMFVVPDLCSACVDSLLHACSACIHVSGAANAGNAGSTAGGHILSGIDFILFRKRCRTFRSDRIVHGGFRHIVQHRTNLPDVMPPLVMVFRMFQSESPGTMIISSDPFLTACRDMAWVRLCFPLPLPRSRHNYPAAPVLRQV